MGVVIVTISIMLPVLPRAGLNKQNILHELYHHIVENLGLEIPEKKEEREAERFVNRIIKKEKEL